MISDATARPGFKAAISEWPTWLLVILVYPAWMILTLYWSSVPGWLLCLVGGFTVALHSSLQHELIHGHPTRNTVLNLTLGWPPLSLWLPLELYCESHMRHHLSDLTHPESDPESFYVRKRDWGALRRWQSGWK